MKESAAVFSLNRSRLRRWMFHLGHRMLAPRLSHPLGHFYSPVCDPIELASNHSSLWPREGGATNIDFNAQGQHELLVDVFPPLLADFAYPDTSDDAHGFFLDNSEFSRADARAMFALLRHWRPRRLVEVGSGYSTLLAADVNRRYLGDSMRITAVEPFPRPFLHGLPGLDELRIERVQDTPGRIFDELAAGDVLFIDSSHVLKTGSDLTHLLTRVLPSLRSGVRVHLHDIFLPDDYPPEWVLNLNRSWNEQYAIHAILVNNPRYRVVYGTHYALTRLADDAGAAFGTLSGCGYAGGSLWIEVQ